MNASTKAAPVGAHLESIDFLRGIAIILVIMSHALGYAGLFPDMPFRDPEGFSMQGTFTFTVASLVANGFFGVMIFFVISGFCIHWSSIHQHEQSWLKFFWRRCFRILPAYWLWLAISVALLGAEAIDVVFHAALIHNFDKDYFYSINSPFWSIAIEFQIYLLYPLLLQLKNKLDRKMTLALFMTAGLGMSLVSTNQVSAIVGGWTDLFSRLPFKLMYAWVLGMYLAEDIGKGILQTRWREFLVCLLIGIACNTHPYTRFLEVVIWPLCSYYLVKSVTSSWQGIGIRNTGPTIRMIRFVSWIGVISYSVYLSHHLLHDAWLLMSDQTHLKPGMASLSWVLLVLIPAMLLVGYISYIIIEKPGTALGRTLYKKIGMPKMAS